MSPTMLCFQTKIRTVAVESCAASRLVTRGSGRSFSTQTRYPIQLSSRSPSTRQIPLLCRSRADIALPTAPSEIADQRRTYAADASQNANTIQGTIGKGASGVREEAQRLKERLQAPDHLNENEKTIFEKLDSALEPTKLEVRRKILGWRMEDKCEFDI
jgi:hypothetical protein